MSEEKKQISCTIPLESGFTHILFNLASQGYSHIYVRYSGSGDDGGVDEMYLVERGHVIEADDNFPELRDDLGLADIEDELSKVLMVKVYEILSHEDNWYDNEGGGGTLFISTEDYKYKGDHYVNVTESVHNDVSGTLGD
jgi:hypothetical protein